MDLVVLSCFICFVSWMRPWNFIWACWPKLLNTIKPKTSLFKDHFMIWGNGHWLNSEMWPEVRRFQHLALCSWIPSLFIYYRKTVPKDYFQSISSLDDMAFFLKRVQSQCWNTYRNETLTRAARSVGKINDVNSFSRNSIVAAAEPVSVLCEVSEHF